MLGASLVVLALLGQAAGPARDPAALVEKLGSSGRVESEAAKSLEGLGSKALPALRASLKSKDPDTRTRARALINNIEGNLLLEGTNVRLDFQSATLDQVVKSLSEQTGFEIGLGGMHAPGSDARWITIQEREPMPFWKAIDRICLIAQLTWEYQPSWPRGPGAPRQRLVLSEPPVPVPPSSSSHGAVHVNVESLSYQSQVSFGAAAAMRAQARAGASAFDGAATKGARSGFGGPRGFGAAPPRTIQFQVHLRFAPEPRMAIARSGPLKLLEAVDDLGNSLLPTARDDQQPDGAMGLTGALPPMFFSGGTAVRASATMHRPERPGKVIKTLRGSAEVLVTATRPSPLVIPLEGALGKTFQNDDQCVVVEKIDTDQARSQTVIELLVDNLDEIHPAEWVSPGGAGGASAMMKGMRGGMLGFGRRDMMGMSPPVGRSLDPSQSPVQVIMSQGQSAMCRESIDRDSGRLTLTFPHVPQMGEAKEIRISSLIRTTTSVPFEFHDLPMP
jgi:hypothetical protein